MRQISIFDYGDPIIIKKRTGSGTDPYKYYEEQYLIINNKIVLKEIPDEFQGVTVTNYYYTKSSIPASNEFNCDFTNGILTFNESENNKTVLIKFWGTGVVFWPSSRVYVEYNSENNIVTTLQDNEDTRQLNEQTRINNEDIRKNNEIIRQDNEDTREENEGDRKTYEITRIENENIRKSNETIRLSNEETRRENENIRIDKEQIRNTSEQTRINNENIRISAEQNRVDNENIREIDEVTRKNNEDIRKNNEIIRQNNEQIRNQQELSRNINTNNLLDNLYNVADSIKLIWKMPVITYNDIILTYPNPEIGWTTIVEDTGKRYRWDGNTWEYIDTISLNAVIENTNKIGDLENLETINKVNLVSSINEIKQIVKEDIWDRSYDLGIEINHNLEDYPLVNVYVQSGFGDSGFGVIGIDSIYQILNRVEYIDNKKLRIHLDEKFDGEVFIEGSGLKYTLTFSEYPNPLTVLLYQSSPTYS